jgi:hypothetical protein
MTWSVVGVLRVERRWTPRSNTRRAHSPAGAFRRAHQKSTAGHERATTSPVRSRVVGPQLLTVLVAFIAPTAALSGVFLGQWMQRRTTREQLAEQRRRDREAHKREDQHRFTEQRRVAYAELLALVQRANSQMYKHAANLEDDHNRPPEEQRDLYDPSRLTEVGIDAEAAIHELDAAGSRVTLIASPSIRNASDDVLTRLTYYIDGIHQKRHMVTTGEAHQSIRDTERLREMMRADLTPADSP